MNAKITSNINLAKKLKKLGSRQETVLAGVADLLTEEEKSNFYVYARVKYYLVERYLYVHLRKKIKKIKN